jgi:hypothetical protein
MTERIYLGSDEDPGEVLRALFDILGPEADQRSIVWVPEEYAVDVPDEVATEYTKPKKAVKATKAAKSTPPPPPDKEE